MARPRRSHPDSLIAAVPAAGEGAGLTESAWVEVIRKMDEVYSDLIRYEVDLERKNAALEQAQQFIGSVIAAMSDILVACDHKGRIQQVNPALVLLTGFSAEELVGQPLTALMFDADAAVFRPADRVREHEARLKKKDGDCTELVTMNGSPRTDSQSRQPGMVIVGRPVGELRRAYEALNEAHVDLKRAQQQLVQSEKLASLGRLVAGVAHELNNPISFIYSNVHTLARYGERLEQYLDAVHDDRGDQGELRQRLKIDALMDDLGPLIAGTLEGAERVSEIVKNLRRLSFVNPADRQRVNLSQIARNALQWVVRGVRKPIKIEDQLPPELVVEGSEGPLHQVLVNLVQNAVDALDETADPQISISGRRVDGQVLVVVRDNGPGLRPDLVSKVFDPFFTTKPVGKGTGLGLWVSWSIVRDHGGALEAANAPTGGAAFTLVLPAR